MNHFLFGIYPYIALVVFVLGSLVRYDRDQYTWKTGSSQLLESKQLRKGSAAFHVGIIAVLAGHFVGLLTPHQVWDFLGVTASFKQAFAMGMGGLFGLICLYGIVILLHRRITNPRVRATTSDMDLLILLLIFAQLLLGLFSIFVSAGHMDGQEMLKLMAWAQHIVILDGAYAAEQVVDVHWIFKAHITLGMTLFVLFPFSRLVHIWSVPVKYFSRNYQVVRSKG
ncbi:respiratory nitrate reductase subunit gamma [Simiduia agarivorans]|uniref:nitrate reductase (quinone) n=1 Tax=Simiduia agarivorans (strain DSM 21679 / JCM 13881 / BCRC 17597 / SA1) TaxID=1117647 RepID=K4KMP9_SIMAS|nr:respiratory nitrate reductase subunit gamma [Simiduia agarivorans]AFV00292.1 respiratory nitrate reductase subunit gamma [Simiduia agarivorans SA1 = DSM 21679]